MDNTQQSKIHVGNELNWLCDVENPDTDITETQIQCRTPTFHSDWGNTMTHGIIVNSRLIVDSTCTSTCEFTYGA